MRETLETLRNANVRQATLDADGNILTVEFWAPSSSPLQLAEEALPSDPLERERYLKKKRDELDFHSS